MPLSRRCPATICAALVFIALAAVSSAELDAKNVLKDCELCKKFINFDAPQPVTGPSQSFLDHYAAVISGNLLLTEKSPAEAIKATFRLFDSARQYVRTIAANQTGQPNIIGAIASSDFYALNQLIGTKLAEYLPDHIGLDHFANNYTQAVLPGLTTALTGINYAPCLFSTGAVGAIGGVTGIGISPKIFNYGASGGAVIAQGVAVSPSLLYISQSGSAGIAIGANVSPSLITVGPTRYIRARVGVAAGKSALSVSFAGAPGPAPAPGPGAAPAAAPATAPAPGAGRGP